MNPAGEQVSSPVRPQWQRWLDRVLTALALAAIGWFYHWTVDTRGGFQSTGEADYYNLLVQGYRQGHLYLSKTPPPELLAVKDPYDPAQNGAYRLPDASYYRGHYYIYFGVVPALVLMLPYAVVTGHELPTGTAVFLFCLAGFLAASGLWLAIRRRYFPDSAFWTGALGVLVLGMSTHVLALASRPMVWELPIASGFAFVMLALVAVYAAIHGFRPLLCLGLAGLCLGLAMASRPPNLFGVAMLLAPLWLAWRVPHPERPWWRCVLIALAGVGLCGVGILAHNYARFDHPLEFGQNYQLTASHELKNRHFGLNYMPHNLAVYYFCPLRWSWEFPFVAAWTPGTDIPDYAGGEEMCGLAVTFPFLWLALAAPLGWWRRTADEGRTLRVMLGAIVGLYLGVGTFLLAFFSTTERGLAEFAPALALLAVCGWLGLERWAQGRRWGGSVLPFTALAAMATVPMGYLVSLNYHGNALSRDNPALWGRMERACHDTLSRVGQWAGVYDGPRVLKVRFKPRPAGTTETVWRSNDAAANERIVVEHLGGREVRFGFGRGDAPVRWGRRVTWKPDHTHTLELQLPSLYGPSGGGGVRYAVALRERSGVAVWFSGGRALGAIVPPLPPATKPGGVVGGDFSGEVRRNGARLFREDELPLNEPSAWVVAGPVPTAGAPRVPLLSAGRTGAGVAFSLECLRPGVGRIVSDVAGGDPVFSPEFPLPAADQVTVEIEPAPMWPWSAHGGEEQGFSVWVAGRLRWETRARLRQTGPEEVFLARNEVGAASCARTVAGWAAAAPPPRGDSGTLRLRLSIPAEVERGGEPLIVVGALYGSDLVGVRGTGLAGEVQFFFEHFGVPVHAGAKVQLAPNQVHTVDITLPSFAPGNFGFAASGDVTVKLNGTEVLRITSACYEISSVVDRIGRNRYGGTVCGPMFRGWLIDARWLGVMER